MPAYVRDGHVNFAWASQVRHIALYVMQQDAVAAAAVLSARSAVAEPLTHRV
jgi:hypothetical protein